MYIRVFMVRACTSFLHVPLRYSRRVQFDTGREPGGCGPAIGRAELGVEGMKTFSPTATTTTTTTPRYVIESTAADKKHSADGWETESSSSSSSSS